MKTLDFELSKRLSDLGLLDDIETEYYFWKRKNDFNNIIIKLCKEGDGIINHKEKFKTLTLEESILFIGSIKGLSSKLVIFEGGYTWTNNKTDITISNTDLFLITEGYIEFLLDNKIIGN